MLKTMSREEMYLLCQELKKEALKGLNAYHPSDNIMAITNEMIYLLDQMPLLEKLVKLGYLVKEVHNHIHNF